MDTRQLKQQIQQATALFQAGRYEEAEVLLLEIAQQNPLYANVYNMLGFIYSQRDAPDKAVELFRQALSVNPAYTEARLNLAITLADSGAYSEAIREYGLAKEREQAKAPTLPTHAQARLANAHDELAKAYQELGLYPQAVQEYEKAIALAPHFPDLHCNLARCYMEAGDGDRAEAALGRALELHPAYADALVQLGLLHYQRRETLQAISAWEKALASDPGNVLAQIYLRMAREGGAGD
ncbi:MAG: tetratricopeptide repeat protein [Candidatus Methylomirabilales bacterium]